jgi:hypothetical protein
MNVTTVLSMIAALVVIVLAAWLIGTYRLKTMAKRLRQELAPEQAAEEVFSPDLVSTLPRPVQRYFLHAITAGTPLASSVRLTMAGTIKLGNGWYPFTASETLTPFRGFVWQAAARVGLVPVQAIDHHLNGRGSMRVWAAALLPLVQSDRADIARSGAGRLAGEALWLPAAFLPQRGVTWEAVNDRHIKATVMVPSSKKGAGRGKSENKNENENENENEGEPVTLHFIIDAEGRVEELFFERWKAEEQAFVPFGMKVEAERSWEGYTIPSRVYGGWWYGTERFASSGAFIRCTISGAAFR